MLRGQLLDGQRQTATENVQLIQLHKDCNLKEAQLKTARAQVEGLEEQLTSLRRDCEKAQADARDLGAQLQDEQKRTAAQAQELAENSSQRQRLAEQEEKARDLQRENAILRESNGRLLDSAYDTERERQFQAAEAALKVQVAQLEATLKGDLADKVTLQDALAREREQVRPSWLFSCDKWETLLFFFFTLKKSVCSLGV